MKIVAPYYVLGRQFRPLDTGFKSPFRQLVSNIYDC